VALIIKHLLNLELINYVYTGFVSNLHSGMQHVSLTGIAVFSLVLISGGWLLYRIVQKSRNVQQKNRGNAYDSTSGIRILVLFSLTLIPLVGIFLIDFHHLGIISPDSLQNPSGIFLTHIVHNILSPLKFANIILLFIILLAVINQIWSFNQHQVNKSNKIFVRKLFLIYPLVVILLTFIFTSVVFYFMPEYEFYSRYVLFCVPFFIILISFTFEEGIIFLDYVFKRVTKQAIKRVYLKNSFLFSFLFAILLVGPKGFKTITAVDNNSWREISKQVITVIEADTSHIYFVVEAAYVDFPTLDYYFKRYSEEVRVGSVVLKSENDNMVPGSDFKPEKLNDKNIDKLEKYDYMIITFIHSGEPTFSNISDFLNSKYKLTKKVVDEKGHGFMIFELP